MFSDGPFDTKVGDTIVGLENGPCKERGSGLGGGGLGNSVNSATV